MRRLLLLVVALLSALALGQPSPPGLSRSAAKGLFPSFQTGWHPGANGLQRWHLGLGQVGKSPGGRGMGGARLKIIGDSVAETNCAGQGVGAVYTANGLHDYLQARWSNQLRIMLQRALNPPGVPGGYGWIPATTGAQYGGAPASSRVWTAFGTTFAATSAAPGVGGKNLTAGSGSHGAYLTLDPTAYPAEYGYGVTDVELVVPQGSGTANTRYDVAPGGTGGAAMIGTGTGGLTGTVGGGSPFTWGKRWMVTGINPAVANTIQVAAPASATTLYFDGAFLYNKDADCGVGVDNYAAWGTKVVNTASSPRAAWTGRSRPL